MVHCTVMSWSLPVACLDKKTNVRVHEWNGHGNILPVRQHRGPVRPSLFDSTKDVVPSDIPGKIFARV